MENEEKSRKAAAPADNPGFTLFVNDVLSWEPWAFLTPAKRGDVFSLIVYAAKHGGCLPASHPVLAKLDPEVVALCTLRNGDTLNVVKPVDLVRLMGERETYLQGKREAGRKGGQRSVEERRKRDGTARPGRREAATKTDGPEAQLH